MKTKLTMLTIALLLTSCAEAPSKTNKLSVNLGGFTHHTSERKGNKDWNEVHNNIGLEYERNNYFVNTEYFKDSFSNDNGIIAAGYKYKPTEWLSIPLGVGTFLNYKNTTVTPYSGLEFNLGEYLTIRTAYMPPLATEQGNKTGFLFGGFRVKAYEWGGE